MQLALDVPTSWETRTIEGQRVVIVPGFAAHPDLLLVISPLVILPDDQRAWIDHTLRVEIPQNARLLVDKSEDLHTETGWPLRVVEARVHTGDAMFEQRLAAFYAFFEHAATVLLRATNAQRYAAQRESLLQLLRTGKPDFHGQVSSLHELWDVAAGKRLERLT